VIVEVLVGSSRSTIHFHHHQVMDRDFLKPDDELGRVELPLTELVTQVTQGTRGLMDGWFTLRGRRGADDGFGRQGKGRGRVEMRVQYRGYQ